MGITNWGELGRIGANRRVSLSEFEPITMAFVSSFIPRARLYGDGCRTTCGQRALSEGRHRSNGAVMTESGRPRRQQGAERVDSSKAEAKGADAETDKESDVQGDGIEDGMPAGRTQDLGETADSEPLYTSSLMTAMRDYFGDDGREVQDYMNRPKNEQGKPLFRIVIVGNGDTDIELARRLRESGLMRGLYYVGDNENRLYPTEDGETRSVEEARKEGLVMTDMAKYADLANEDEAFSGEDVVTFSTWCVADGVFMGEKRAKECGREVESALADMGITMFAPDVGKAIARGELDIFECLSSLIDEEGDGAESLIE